MLERFARKVWLRREENRWWVNLEWELGRSTRRYSHARCSDHEIIRCRRVTSTNITEQLHRNAKIPFTSWPCDDSQSDRYTASPKNSFFLQFADSSHAGSTNPRDWVIYGHVYPVANGIVLQHWQLYAYNDSFASANHLGDWEFTAVLTDRNEVQQRVRAAGTGVSIRQLELGELVALQLPMLPSVIGA